MPQVVNRWLSAYLFFEGATDDIYSARADRIVCEVVAPFVTQNSHLFTRSFFIRYGENGPHIRLRLQNEPEILMEQVVPALVQWVANCDGLRLAWAVYEPEIGRYGGEHAIALAESIFEQSSHTALDLLPQLQSHTAKLGQTLLLMTVLIYTFTDTRQDGCYFAQQYSRGYLNALIPPQHRESWRTQFERGFASQADTLVAYVQNVWERLDTEVTLTPLLDRYYEQMCAAREEFERLFVNRQLIIAEQPATDWMPTVCRIVSSYLHMTNNRLGVSIPEEAYLAHLVACALQEERA